MINRAECAISVYCLCGGKMYVSAPVGAAMKMKEIFWSQHQGPGHGPCDAQTCHRNRQRAEAAQLAEEGM